MAIAQIPQQVPSAVQGASHRFKGSIRNRDARGTRSLAISSLIAGVVLLARGKRKAGLLAAAAGVAIALLEEPKEVAAAWNNVPSYLQAGKRLLSRLEGFVEDLSGQGDRLRSFLDKTQR